MKKILLIFVFVITCSFSFAEELTGVFDVPFNTERNAVLDKMAGNGYQILYINTLESYENFYKSSIPILRFFKPNLLVFGNPVKEITFYCENEIFTNAEVVLKNINLELFKKNLEKFVKNNSLKECKYIATNEYTTFPFISKNGNIFAYVIEKNSRDITLIYLCTTANEYEETFAAIKQDY